MHLGDPEGVGEVPRACWLCGRGIWACVTRDVPMYPSISGLVAEYIVATDVTRVRFPADASLPRQSCCSDGRGDSNKMMLALHFPGSCLYLLCNGQRPCGLMDKALVFGTKDFRPETCQGQVLFVPSRLAPSFPERCGPPAVPRGRRKSPPRGSNPRP